MSDSTWASITSSEPFLLVFFLYLTLPLKSSMEIPNEGSNFVCNLVSNFDPNLPFAKLTDPPLNGTANNPPSTMAKNFTLHEASSC